MASASSWSIASCGRHSYDHSPADRAVQNKRRAVTDELIKREVATLFIRSIPCLSHIA